MATSAASIRSRRPKRSRWMLTRWRVARAAASNAGQSWLNGPTATSTAQSSSAAASTAPSALRPAPTSAPRERSAPSAAPESIAQGTGTTSVHLSRSSASTVGSGVTTKLTLAPAAAAASASAVQRATWPRPDSAPPSVMKAKRVRSVTDQLPHLGRREPDAVRVARVSEARSRSLAPFPGAKGPGGVERLDHEHLVVLERLAALVLGDEDLVELFPGAA